MTTLEQILSTLSSRPLSSMALAIELKTLPREVKTLTATLVEQGLLEQTSDGLFRYVRTKLILRTQSLKGHKKPQAVAKVPKLRSVKAKPVQAMKPVPEGLTLTNAALECGLKRDALYQRLRGYGLLERCTLQITWYIPLEVLEQVRQQKHSNHYGYTPLAKAAERRGMTARALKKRLEAQLFGRFRAFNGVLHVHGPTLQLSDAELDLDVVTRLRRRKRRKSEIAAMGIEATNVQ